MTDRFSLRRMEGGQMAGSSLQGAQGNGSPSALGFTSLTSPRSSYVGLNALGSFSSVPSVNGVGNVQLTSLNQGLSGGGNSSLSGPGSHTPLSTSGISGSPSVQRSLSVGAESLGLTGAGSMGLPASPRSFSSNTLNLSGTTGLVASSLSRQGGSNVTRMDQPELQQLQQQQQQITVANTQYSQEAQQVVQQQQQQQHQLEQHSQGQELATSQQLQGQQIMGGAVSHLRSQQVFGLGTQQQLQSMQGGMATVKLEQQQMSQQMQPMQGLASIKLEQQIDSPLRQQLQSIQGLTSVKLEQQIDSSLRQQLQQQQQVQAGIAPMKLDQCQHEQHLHQRISIPKMEMKLEPELPQQAVQQSLLTSHLQRQEALLHCQQNHQLRAQMNLLQQQRLLQQHRAQLQQQQQLQQHLQQQMAGPSRQLYEPGICARRLMQYMFNQRQRPQDNNIAFWRKFVTEYFAPRAKKRWCVSQYGSSGRQPTGVFPQDVWHCEICGSRPGRGFETTVEVLPRLCKIKYDSGILDELLYVDISNEFRLSSGLMVLEYGKAIQESIFDQLRVVRDGQLRIIFSPDLKILSWEFCAKGHEELLPRRLLVPQVTHLATIAQKYQTSVNQNQNGGLGLSMQDLQTNCQLFVGTARQLARTLEAPTVNDLGYTKRYVRCLQISEVVNSMKDLIDFSRETRTGPMVSLINFPRRTASIGGLSNQASQQQEQMGLQAIPSEQKVDQASKAQSSVVNNSLNGSINNVAHNANSMGAFPTLLAHNSLTTLQNSLQNNVSGSMATSVNTSSSGSCPNSLQPPQGTAISSLQTFHPTGQPSPLSAMSHSAQQNSLSSAVNLLQQSSGQPSQGNQHESSTAVHHLLQEMMMPSQFKSGSSFQQAFAGGGIVAGNVGLNGGMVGGIGNSMNNANGTGVSANATGVSDGSSSMIGNAMSNDNYGSIGGMNNNFSHSGTSLNSLLGNASGMRNLSSNMLVNNMGAGHALGGRFNLSAMPEEPNLSIQDPSESLLQELGGSDILGSLGHTSFNNSPFSWKSP